MPTTTIERKPSAVGSLAPSYTTVDELAPANGRDIELTSFDGRSSTSLNELEDGPPPYPRGEQPGFHPTATFQIQTPGKRLLSFPTPPRPDPIPVFPVDPSGRVLDAEAYTSVRPERRSGSCFLAGADGAAPLSTTAYRWGPGKPPVVALFDPAGPMPALTAEGAVAAAADDNGGPEPWDSFTLKGKSLFSRSVGFQTRLGTFEWRYAARKERKSLEANNVLVLDRVQRVFVAGGKEEESRTPVARLVRNEELRSPGSSASTAGNGGRLYVDVGAWAEESKTERRMAEVLVVTTCVAMLKKEVDRRRAQQIAVMSAAASGGP